jgi:uncharacterized membrane protein YfcA
MNLLFFIVIILFASFYQGITGFGFALIAAPLALLVLDKYTVVTSLTVIGLILNAFLFKKIKHPLNLTLLLPLFLASVIGMPIGIWILKTVSINVLKVIVGCVSIIFALKVSFTKISLPQTKTLTAIAGFLSGLFQTSISMGGPPVVILLTGAGKEKNEMRKIFVTFFLWLNIISLPFFLISRTLTLQRAKIGFYALPFVLLGAYLGNIVVKKIPQKAFKLIALATVCITGLLSIYSGLS